MYTHTQTADKSALEALSNTIDARLKDSKHNRPAFNPDLPVSALNEKWEALLAAEKERESALYTELARQERLENWVKQFDNEVAEMERWASQKEAYLNTTEVIETLTQVYYMILCYIMLCCVLRVCVRE